MPRKPRDTLFRKNDFARLVEAARRQNLPISRIDITRNGLSLVVGEAETADEDKTNPWDEVANDAANEKRPA